MTKVQEYSILSLIGTEPDGLIETCSFSRKRNVANPWTIIGVAPFPHVEARQMELL